MTIENKKIPVEFKDGKLCAGLDLNQDGEKMLDLKLNLGEALEEVMSREDAVDGVKIVDFKFEMTKLVLKIDSDKDGETLLDLKIDLAEAFDEATGLMKK